MFSYIAVKVTGWLSFLYSFVHILNERLQIQSTKLLATPFISSRIGHIKLQFMLLLMKSLVCMEKLYFADFFFQEIVHKLLIVRL